MGTLSRSLSGRLILFIGAMVATPRAVEATVGVPRLSVPFSSGQWLLLNAQGVRVNAEMPFQSPFHRGNGCYLMHKVFA